MHIIPAELISVEGESMSPFIQAGDRVAISPIEKKLNIGDVVCFRDSDCTWIMHRLVRRNGNLLKIKGDKALCIDNLNLQDVWGRITHVRKADGTTYPLKNSWIDKLIAWVSPWALPPKGLRMKLVNFVICILGKIRRFRL